jgi:hypothetical protein
MSNRLKLRRRRHCLRVDEQVAMMAMAHFPEVIACAKGERLEALSCFECVDYQSGSCEGKDLKGWGCIACMDSKISEGEKLVFMRI